MWREWNQVMSMQGASNPVKGRDTEYRAVHGCSHRNGPNVFPGLRGGAWREGPSKGPPLKAGVSRS